jgi:hypothetical protein
MEENRRGGISLENRLDEKGLEGGLGNSVRRCQRYRGILAPVECVAAAGAQPHAPALVTEPSGKTK